MGNEKEKGDLLEDIVALLHQQEGVKIDKRIKVPVGGTSSKRKREIDVLLTSYVAGYPVKIAIECKNERKKVGSGKIDAFVGKLKDVGIPAQQGIYVSPTGYTKDALERAKKDGIRTLSIQGLTSDGLAVEIHKARQSMVYLALRFEFISRFRELPEDFPNYIYKRLPEERQVIVQLDYDKYGVNEVGILNAIWDCWIAGKIPATIGKCQLTILYRPFSKGSFIIACCKIVEYLHERSGNTANLYLKNAETNKVDRHYLRMSFDEQDKADRLVIFESEEELSRYIDSISISNIHERVKIPRIIYQTCYWPPSKHAIQRIRELYDAEEDITFEEVEGNNLYRAWESYFEETASSSDEVNSGQL